MRIAIDSGGTFTDCVYLKNSELAVLKLPSTPGDPARSVINAIQQITGEESCEVRHGTTIGTNALLERKGARVAFVTTAGFEDTIAIGRQARRHLYDWMATPAECIVPRELRFGVPERVTAEREILRAPSARELAQLRRDIQSSGAESVAISLLFSFANAENEKKVAECLSSLRIPLSISHQLLPEFREYERAASVVVNAYLAPKAGEYVQRLESAIQENKGSLYVMQSSGGIISAKVAGKEPVRTVLSGPAGGVIGAHRVARLAGFEKIISFDMGGTSTDVSLIDTRGPQITNESRISELPISVPMLDIQTVGAGGGSLAWFDRGGILHVGPQSAGADPGPICYGRGEQPTVTDANLVLGRLDRGLALAGSVRLDEGRTCRYMKKARGPIASLEEFASGIVRLAEAEMGKAIRLISIERGHDPREFTLVAFGGAGPLHACALARSLEIPRVLVPIAPGALSALGIFGADVVRDYSRTVMLNAQALHSAGSDNSKATAFNRRGRGERNESAENGLAASEPPLDLDIYFAGLERQAIEDFRNDGLRGVSVRSVDLRYAGQGYEINVPAGTGMLDQFHEAHRLRYGHADKSRQVEIVNARVRMIAKSQPLRLPERPLAGADATGAVLTKKKVMFGSQWLETTVFDRGRLMPGNRFSGPAIVHEYSATTVVPPGCKVQLDKYSNLIIDV
jgi:N-methylhydantoinase A